MIIVAVVLVIMMMSSGQKETYYGYMKNSTTLKRLSRKDHEVEENIKLPAEDGFSPKHGDFVKLVKSEGDDAFSEMKVVKHDDVPHGLMMKIHDMGDMKGM